MRHIPHAPAVVSLAVVLFGCPPKTEREAVQACYELADLTCTNKHECGHEDKYECMEGYIRALPCHEALDISSKERLEWCIEDKQDAECGAPNPPSCRNLIEY